MAPGTLRGRHVLLLVGGGVAAYKAVLLTRLLVRAGAEVDVAMTQAATTFVGAATFEGVTGRRAHTDLWADPSTVLHLRLARAADAAIVAPATANLIAKAAAGVADDLVTTVLTCLTCPVIVAPAMHTEMWRHPATRDNVATLERRGLRLVGPATGELAGGDIGEGRLAEPEDVFAAVLAALGPGSLAGRTILVTAGGTREPIDPVRFIGNRSSGKMGFAIAAEAARRGGHVELVTAPAELATPAGVIRHDVETALEMRAAVLDLAPSADVIVKAAAVADARPVTAAGQKIKKDSGGLERIELTANPDILAELGASDLRAVLVGFAAETSDVEAQGRAKLARKGADLLVANHVGGSETGFSSDDNAAVLLHRDGARVKVGRTSKARLAAAILDEVETLLPTGSAGSPFTGSA